jgi:hypothetical protein
MRDGIARCEAPRIKRPDEESIARDRGPPGDAAWDAKRSVTFLGNDRLVPLDLPIGEAAWCEAAW